MEKKTVAIAADHAGYALKEALKIRLTEAGYAVIDAGTDSDKSCDYPLYAEAGCRKILNGEAELCILCCGTGAGMSIAANKMKGIRAACCSDVFTARYIRLHNDANVLCLGARVVGEGLAWALVSAFLGAGFEGGKHARRVGLITALEEKD
jgi:ribose 5-phosphate isomerase B